MLLYIKLPREAKRWKLLSLTILFAFPYITATVTKWPGYENKKRGGDGNLYPKESCKNIYSQKFQLKTSFKSTSRF